MERLKSLNAYVANGGKTDTAVSPAGTSAKDADKVVILVSVGEPPPKAVPGAGEPPVACPLCWKFRSGIIMAIPIMDTPSAPVA